MHLPAQQETHLPKLSAQQARPHLLCQLSSVARTCEAVQVHTTHASGTMSTGTVDHHEANFCTACLVSLGGDALGCMRSSYCSDTTCFERRGAVLSCPLLSPTVPRLLDV